MREFLKPGDENERVYRECDPDLYDALQAINCSGRLNVAQIKKRGILPAGTVFYPDPLPKVGVRSQADRDAWAKKALLKTAACDLVFLDPDNGLASATMTPNSPEHVRPSEIRDYVDRCRDQSVVLYQSHTRTPVVRQTHDQQEQMQEAFGRPVFAMPYGRHKGS